MISLKDANLALAEGRYDDAISSYYQIIENNPNLAQSIAANIKFAKDRLNADSLLISAPQFFIKNITQKVYIDLLPNAGISILDKFHNTFLSCDRNPKFTLQIPEKFCCDGWYEFTVQINTEETSPCAKLCINDELESIEEHAYELPFKSSAVHSRIIYFAKPPKQLRFLPLHTPHSFSILKLELNKLEVSEVLNKMVETLKKQEASLPTGLVKMLNQSDNPPPDNQLLQLYRNEYEPIFKKTHKSTVDYAQWIDLVEKPSLPSIDLIQKTFSSQQYHPLISIILPTYNSNPDFLKACIESVLNQSYPNWELCIADDASTNLAVIDVIKYYAACDSRIKFFIRPNNGNISAASNTALNLAAGDYVALLDHDDLLSEHALFYIFETINRYKQAKIIYSDEDKIDEYGVRFEPHFKCDWNPDLFYSQNYVSHLGVYSRSLLDKVRGFRVGVEGAQDQDLMLRCLQYVKSSEIIHIPKILYHWRAHAESTASNAQAKSYTSAAGLKSLRDYFQKENPDVQVEPDVLDNTYRLFWPITRPEPMVTLLIPTKDKVNLLSACVQSILDKTSYSNYEIIIVDNGSTELDAINYLEDIQKKESAVRVIKDYGDFNFSRLNNYGFRHANGVIYGLINNDIEVINSNWLTEMVSHVIRLDIGCVGAKLIYSNEKIQHAGVVLGIGGVAGHSHKYFGRDETGYFSRLKLVQNISAVTGACLLVRKDVYDAVGGLDEKNLKIAFNDVDFCLRVSRLGFRNLWTPNAELYHHESISRGKEDTPEKQTRFAKEVEYMRYSWGHLLQRDPYYSPHLTLLREDFSLAIK